MERRSARERCDVRERACEEFIFRQLFTRRGRKPGDHKGRPYIGECLQGRLLLSLPMIAGFIN
jgi:hypothetical protein